MKIIKSISFLKISQQDPAITDTQISIENKNWANEQLTLCLNSTKFKKVMDIFESINGILGKIGMYVDSNKIQTLSPLRQQNLVLPIMKSSGVDIDAFGDFVVSGTSLMLSVSIEDQLYIANANLT